MTPHETSSGRLGRRTALGLLGAASIAAAGARAASAEDSRAGTDGSSASSGPALRALRPGGEFDRLLARLAAQDRFSGTVLLVHKGRTVLTRSYGEADKQRSIPNGPDTLFCLGSITKVFTAVAVAQLAQQGKVAFHEKLGAYLGGFPTEVADKVTIHQLLTHTSGMGDFMAVDGYRTESQKWTSPQQVMDGCLAFVQRAPLQFTPGAGWRYSNSGYHVLGSVISEVSGQSYYDYIRENIFRRAGMTSADFITKPQWREDPRFAHPYTTQHQPQGEQVEAIDYYLYTGIPAGNSFASAPDLVRFTKALLGHELLNSAYTELTLGAKVPKPPLSPKPGLAAHTPFDSYATGTDIIGDQWVVGHNGGAPGTFTNLEWFPGSDWIAVVLTNYDRDSDNTVVSTARALITRS